APDLLISCECSCWDCNVEHMKLFPLACGFCALALAAHGVLSAGQRPVAGVPPSGAFVLEEATISSIHAAFASKQLTCVELVRSYLSRIERYDDTGPALNAILTVHPKAL